MKIWTLKLGTEVFSQDGNRGRVVMETGLGSVVIVWDKQPHDRFVFTEREMKRLGVSVVPSSCFRMVEVRGGQALAASRNCSGKVVYVDHLGRGWCKRHAPCEDTKRVWARIGEMQHEGK